MNSYHVHGSPFPSEMIKPPPGRLDAQAIANKLLAEGRRTSPIGVSSSMPLAAMQRAPIPQAMPWVGLGVAGPPPPPAVAPIIRSALLNVSNGE